MKKIDISIIIPVYNVKDYLERCVKSVLAQTLHSVEILLIDDGSTDGSAGLCDQYAAQHPQIKVIHQLNGGLSAARNTGIKAAQGEYLLFVDSDDYIEPESCEKLFTLAKKYDCDIVKANAWSKSNSHQNHEPGTTQSSKPEAGLTFITRAIRERNMVMCAQFGLYKTSFIRINQLYFYPSIYHEDELWTPQVYLKAQRVWGEDYCFYYHWTRESSITQTSWSEKRKNDILTVCNQLYPLYEKQLPVYRLVLLDYLCQLYLHAINQSKDKLADRYFPLQTAYFVKNKLKAWSFFLSPTAYFYMNRICAMLKRKIKNNLLWNMIPPGRKTR